MPKELRVAVIGAGNMGNEHLRAYTTVTGAKPVVVVDIIEEKAIALQDTYHIPEHHTNYQEVVTRPDIDMVDVCVPTWVHEEVTVAAARAGKHVLCEKPISLTQPAAERMQEAAQQSGVLLMLAFCRHYCNEWLKVRDLVQSGELGRPVVWRSLNAVHGGKQPWFVQRDQGGGPFIDGAIHNFDFARFIFGEAAQVTASTCTYREDATAIDTGTAIVTFASGDDLLVSWSWGLPAGARGSAVNDMIGPKGALYFGRSARADFSKLPPLEPGYGAIVIDRGKDGIEQYPYLRNDMYRDEIQAFVDAIHSGQSSPVDATAGIKSLAIARAILEAGESRQVVRL